MGTSIHSELLNRRKSSPSKLGSSLAGSFPDASPPSLSSLSPSREAEIAGILAQQPPMDEGLVLKTLGEVFSRIKQMEGYSRCTVRVSLIEVGTACYYKGAAWGDE